MKEPKRCPFYGAITLEHELEVHHEPLDDYPWQIFCSCGAKGPVAITREDAITFWNTRQIGMSNELAVKIAIGKERARVKTLLGLDEDV